MIRGVGIDIIENVRIKKVFSRFGSLFAKKILSANELEEFSQTQKKVNFLAKRFASKEALSKSIGIGLYRQGLSPTIIDIKKDGLGKPTVLINKELKIILNITNITTAYINQQRSDI